MRLKPAFLFLTFLIISIQITAQDLIFKKGGEKIEAVILKKTGQSRSYKLFNQPDSSTYFINATILDSIVYQNGEKEDFRFSSNAVNVPLQNNTPLYKHNLIGTGLLALLYGNASVSYEYLPGKCHLGLKGTLSFNLHPRYLEDWEVTNNSYDYHNFNDDTKWYTLIGINYYFFPPGTFRFSTGLHYLFGTYTVGNTVYNQDGSFSSLNKADKQIHGFVMSLGGFYNINPSLAINLGLYFPLSLKPNFRRTIASSEILINF